jgi:lysozyme
VIDELRRFMTMVEEHTRKPVLMKLSRRFDAAYGVSAAIPRPVWAVQDFFPPDYAARPWRMWQANDMRRIDGVSGAINWDVVAP